MLGALVGFVAPFLPDRIKLLSGWVDQEQEMQMLALRLQNASKEHEWHVQ